MAQSRFKPVAYVKQEEYDNDLSMIAAAIDEMANRLTLVEAVLAGFLGDDDEAEESAAIMEAAPEADEAEETPEEEAARLIAEAEAANEDV